ncbi:hypothetical protein MNEG_16322 [Monoraphidium neglectum]|uniref:Uncharacterized protein n=1 Tax=Monoraphidium neglectum TaxID=145388 RepID=A0A0D2IUQ8_9CHLO|nr:hypothetical protein MNEG_16322 [Monoraphidium neglectum]KIY91642.1 hypothetical protein MNEG_16322 [Monoraphidium neglectum]|eukprot:XP_013890662.1 hypothetical protein MNEG_16322 [Monoraphidium neglectum]
MPDKEIDIADYRRGGAARDMCDQKHEPAAEPAVVLAEPPTLDRHRLELVQRLAARLQQQGGAGGAGDSGGAPVAIVAVSGWDSCWHAESSAFLDWLCGGAAPADTLAVVTAAAAAVLCPAPAPARAANGAGGYTAARPRQRRGSRGDPTADCQDLSEEAALAALAADPKVSAFRRLLAAAGAGAAPRLAAPLGWEVAGGALRRAGTCDVADGGDCGGGGPLARWPLVQAVEALEGDALPGRFEEVLDVSYELRALMGRADARAARALLSERAPALRRAWGEVQGLIGRTSPVARGVELSEEQRRVASTAPKT